MIRVDLNEAEAIAVVRPDRMHGLSEDYFELLTDRIDRYLEDYEALRGLVIVTRRFPGWESLAAFTSHMRFVRDHHRAICKVALVSDSRLLSVAPRLANLFVKAQVRRFPFADIEDARRWITADEPPGQEH